MKNLKLSLAVKTRLVSFIAFSLFTLSSMAASQAYKSNVPSTESKRNMHISLDDTYAVLLNLTLNSSTYTSIFDNPLLSKLKEYHVKYGAVFSLYCFTDKRLSTGYVWHIENSTTKFADEFRQNASWLKFGFHYGNPAYYVSIAYYERFINSIIAITGGTDNFDLIPRLHTFAGTYDFCMQLKNYTPIGVLGFLSADDTRSNYYLSTEQNTYINANDSLYDSVNKLYFFKSETRLESVNVATFLPQYLTTAYATQSNNMIIFTHEYCLYDSIGMISSYGMLSKIESCLTWAINNGYKFDYPMNVIPIKSSPTIIENTKVQDSRLTISKNRIFISFENATNAKIRIYNIQGILVGTTITNEKNVEINSNALKGIYFIYIEANNRIIKQKISLF